VFGIAATHTNSDGDETAVTVMLQMELAPTGEFGERMEERMTLELAKSHGAAIGDTFSIENDATTDDTSPDPTVWQATQLLTDDGYLRKFAVIEST
jgi:hypothetical protein